MKLFLIANVLTSLFAIMASKKSRLGMAFLAAIVVHWAVFCALLWHAEHARTPVPLTQPSSPLLIVLQAPTMDALVVPVNALAVTSKPSVTMVKDAREQQTEFKPKPKARPKVQTQSRAQPISSRHASQPKPVPGLAAKKRLVASSVVTGNEHDEVVKVEKTMSSSQPKSALQPISSKKETVAVPPVTQPKPAATSVSAQQYHAQVLAHIQRYHHFPKRAQRLRQQGRVVLSFTINRNGKIDNLHLLESSGYRLLDQAAQRTVQQALPLPTPPEELPTHQLSVQLPLAYALTVAKSSS